MMVIGIGSKWGIGGLDLDVQTDRGPATAAARYALGYCQHQAGIVGQWVRDRKRLPRVYEVYGELREAMRSSSAAGPDASDASAADQAANDNDSDDSPTKKRSPSTRTVGERMGDCGSGSAVMLKRYGFGGKPNYKYLGGINQTPGRLALADKIGELKTLSLNRIVHTLPNGEQTVRVSLPLGDQTAKEAFARLQSQAQILRLEDLAERANESSELESQTPEADDCLPADQEGGDDVAPF